MKACWICLAIRTSASISAERRCSSCSVRLRWVMSWLMPTSPMIFPRISWRGTFVVIHQWALPGAVVGLLLVDDRRAAREDRVVVGDRLLGPLAGVQFMYGPPFASSCLATPSSRRWASLLRRYRAAASLTKMRLGR